MAYTTPENVGQVVGITFSTTTIPTYSAVSGTFIPWSDRQVDNDATNLGTLSVTDKEMLSTFYCAHLVTVGAAVDSFKAGDVSISSKSSRYLDLYNSLKRTISEVNGGTVLFQTVNK